MTRVGIIGTGWGTRVQIPAFRRAGLEIVAIAGRDPDKTSRLAREHEVPNGYGDWRRILDHEEIDLVTVVTPPFQHLEMASAVLDAGKHVVSEKPTAMNADEARALVDLSRQHADRFALIDHELRFLPAWRTARARIGEIGQIRWAEARYSSPSRNDPERRWNWWSSEEHGGGILGAVGSHLIDAFRYFIGEITETRAILRTLITERPDNDGNRRKVTSDDWGTFDLRFTNDAIATVTVSVVSGVDEPTELVIHGSEGSLELVENRFLLASINGEWKDQIDETEEPITGDSPGGYFGTGTIYLGRALKQAISEGDCTALEPGATFEDGLRQQQTLDAIRRSSRNGGIWDRVPPLPPTRSG